MTFANIWSRKTLHEVRDVGTSPRHISLARFELRRTDLGLIFHPNLNSLHLKPSLRFASGGLKVRVLKGFKTVKQTLWVHVLNSDKLERLFFHFDHGFWTALRKIYKAPVFTSLRIVHLWDCPRDSKAVLMFMSSLLRLSEVHTFSLFLSSSSADRKAPLSFTAPTIIDRMLRRSQLSTVNLWQLYEEDLNVASLFKRARDYEGRCLKNAHLDDIHTRISILRIISECCRALLIEKLDVGNRFSEIFTALEIDYLGNLVHFNESSPLTVEFLW